MGKLLTIGMATYDDYDGVFFTIQSLRLHHPVCVSDQVEFVVIDNNPDGRCSEMLKSFLSDIGGRYVAKSDKVTSWSKYSVAEHAQGDYILIMDSHVLLAPGSIDSLLAYYHENPDTRNLIQGPLIYDNLINYCTHLKPGFGDDSLAGSWATNKEAYDIGVPFEIEMQGMGLLSFAKKHWPGINPHFRGFGGEEKYVAEKFRLNGGKNICLPTLKWVHRFRKKEPPPFKLTVDDKAFNHLVGWLELYQNPEHPMVITIIDHFKSKLSASKVAELFNEAKSLTIK